MVDLDSNPTKLIEVVEIGKQLLITRGALTTFSIANDVAKYFAIIPAMFLATFPLLGALNIMGLRTPQSAILSAVIFNALIIVALVPLALRGIKYRPEGAAALLRRNLLIYGVGGDHRPVHRHQAHRRRDHRASPRLIAGRVLSRTQDSSETIYEHHAQPHRRRADDGGHHGAPGHCLSAGDHGYRPGRVPPSGQRSVDRAERQGHRLEPHRPGRSRRRDTSGRGRRRPERATTRRTRLARNSARRTRSSIDAVKANVEAARAGESERPSAGRPGHDLGVRASIRTSRRPRRTSRCRAWRASAASQKRMSGAWSRPTPMADQLGFFGEAGVNVLELNLALDAQSAARTVVDGFDMAGSQRPTADALLARLKDAGAAAAARLYRRRAGRRQDVRDAAGGACASCARPRRRGRRRRDVRPPRHRSTAQGSRSHSAPQDRVSRRRRCEEMDVDAIIAPPAAGVRGRRTGPHERPRQPATRSATRTCSKFSTPASTS